MKAAGAKIGDWLGLQSPATEGEILRIVEGRLALSVIRRLAALGLERMEIDTAGRWHYAGHPIVYLAETPASALLEVCVHTSANDVPPAFTLLKIEGPDVNVPSVSTKELPEDWRTRLQVTRDLGTAWLKKNESVLLRVPSALVPETVNFLFNPPNTQAKRFHVTDVFWVFLTKTAKSQFWGRNWKLV